MNTNETSQQDKILGIGEIVHFGDYGWRVLDISGNKALIITEDIIEEQPYHKPGGSITWRRCTLREYLNHAFYDRFKPEDKARIIQVSNKNINNQWFNKSEDSATRDRVFLLSLDEVTRYFGDSSEKLRNQGRQYYIDDENNANRMSKLNGKAGLWWLRSHGYCINRAAFVDYDGIIFVFGNVVDGNSGGVRPALWLNLK